MSKRIQFAIFTLTICVGFTARAAENTYARGRVIEVAGDHEVDSGFAKQVLFKRADDGTTTIEIQQESRPTVDFRITERHPAGCGSLKYSGIEKAVPGSPLRTVEVVDHTRRRCDDIEPYQWDMILKEKGHPTRHLIADSEDVEFLSLQ